MIENSFDPAKDGIRFRSRRSSRAFLEQVGDRIPTVENCILGIADGIRRQNVKLIDLLAHQKVEEGWDDARPAQCGEALVDGGSKFHPYLALFPEKLAAWIGTFDEGVDNAFGTRVELIIIEVGLSFGNI